MSEANSTKCDICESLISRATRIESGLKYCASCYARAFKRRLCSGCGDFKRLPVADEHAVCKACYAAQPCARCKRSGRPVGRITSYGPVCNSCAFTFSVPQSCGACGRPSQRLTTKLTEQGRRKVCPRCARADHRTCGACRRHRPCTLGEDGVYRCKHCATAGEIPCSSCAQMMPAGRRSRCENCYWLERFAREASQLGELIHGAEARRTFVQFATWLSGRGELVRATRRLKSHVQFFVALDTEVGEALDPDRLMATFGSARLRRFQLVVDWLREQRGVAFTSLGKQMDAERRRVAAMLQEMPSGSLAAIALADFNDELAQRHTAGTITLRTVRMALRPALALFQLADPSGQRWPSQSTLESYLATSPGQRAAASTFVGYARTRLSLQLRLPPKGKAASAAARTALERLVRRELLERNATGSELSKWLLLGLRYFHRLTSAQARAVLASAQQRDAGDGVELHTGEATFWLPKPLSIGAFSADALSKIAARAIREAGPDS